MKNSKILILTLSGFSGFLISFLISVGSFAAEISRSMRIFNGMVAEQKVKARDDLLYSKLNLFLEAYSMDGESFHLPNGVA